MGSTRRACHCWPKVEFKNAWGLFVCGYICMNGIKKKKKIWSVKVKVAYEKIGKKISEKLFLMTLGQF